MGDKVTVGQLIAEADGPVSSPVHSSVSGVVKKIEDFLRPDGKRVPAIRIESDGLMTEYEGLTPPVITDVDSLIEAVKASGLVGLGGAGYPVSAKLSALKEGNIHTLLINGAECEPYITTDSRTMIEDGKYVFEGVKILKNIIPDLKVSIGIEQNKPEGIEEMVRIFGDDESVTVHVLPSYYPQGSEEILTYNTLGITVPEGKRPSDIGVLVVNVTSLCVFAKYAETGLPLVSRHITVDGSAIKEPKNVRAPIGTSIQDILEFVGCDFENVGKVIYGGPMMGICAHSFDSPVLKTTNALTVLDLKDAISGCTIDDSTACIHCGRCVDACPVSLNPVAFSKAMGFNNRDEKMSRLEESKINLCTECGCCSYVCPAKRPLVQTNRIAKAAFRAYKQDK
jgi:electron transport complex protein RnfC